MPNIILPVAGRLQPISRFVRLVLLTLTITLSTMIGLHAEQVVLSIDPALSSLDLRVDLLTTTIPGQGPNSTSATSSGLIAVDVDATGAPTSLEILGSDFHTAITGDWLPGIGGGTSIDDPGPAAPANYGYVLDLGALGTGIGYLAFRDIAYNIRNPFGPETVTSGQFFSDSQQFDISSGTWAINLPDNQLVGEPVMLEDSIIDDPGDGVFNDEEISISSYTVAGSAVTLTIPVSMYDVDSSGNLEFFTTGTLVATANLASPVTSDFDQDGDTDGNDFLLWQRGYGIQGTAMLGDGDGNGDGNVDERDLTVWQSLDGFVAGLVPPPAVTGVPEPASVLLVSLGALAAVSRFTRRRRG